MFRLVTLVFLLSAQMGFAFECGTKSTCKQMASCEEAQFHWQQCGLAKLDADNDGSPCEAVCGDGTAQITPQALLDSGTCGAKRKCGQMDSCEEAQFYLKNCGVRSLDRDNDGQACESLCN